MIQCRGLTKAYGSKHAILSLDLDVAPGEILGFLGPNGAGKSTTVKILTGLLRADSGQASLAGFDIATQPIEAKRRLGYVPETPKVYESLTPDGFLDIVGALYHLDPATSRARRDGLFELLQLDDARRKRMRELSKGMRQKVVVAAALLHNPDVLILDEPFDGIDASTTLVFKSLLTELAAQGKAILFSSHILEVAERICTRIAIIDEGRKVAEGTAAELMSSYRVASLELAFARLTGEREAGDVTAGILAAMQRT